MRSFPISASFGSWRDRVPTSPPGANEAISRSEETQRRLDRSMLALEALWELVQEKLDLSDEDLADRIVEIDMRDGKLDNKRRTDPAVCPQCERVVSIRFYKCLYCGEAIAKDPFA